MTTLFVDHRPRQDLIIRGGHIDPAEIEGPYAGHAGRFCGASIRATGHPG
jgi:hypothetical protein